MRITKDKISKIINKYLPEYKKIVFNRCSNATFISFIGHSLIHYPSNVSDKMAEYPRKIVLIASILHEIGHLVTSKRHPNTINKLVKSEGNAQKWAIEKAIELNLSVVAKCLLEEFALWENDNGWEPQNGCDPLYNKCNPYSIASIQNSDWINTKIAAIF